MKKWLLPGLILIASVAFAGGVLPALPWNDFGFEMRESDAGLKMQCPSVTLTDSEKAKLYAGKPVTRLMDAPGGYKLGYLRFFAPFDPVTAYMVVTDVENYDRADPAFDRTGSVTERNRSFWPNALENDACIEKGELRMNQLIMLPFLSPRRMCLVGAFDTKAFPWESFWDLAKDADCCKSQQDEAFMDHYDKAISVTRNKESWHISPLPKSFRKTKGDILRADCIYIADVNPGGDLGKMDRVASIAAKMSLPQLAKHVVARGKTWEPFLTEQYGPETVRKYREWVARYQDSFGAEDKK
jgi:hypothetical protein